MEEEEPPPPPYPGKINQQSDHPLSNTVPTQTQTPTAIQTTTQTATQSEIMPDIEIHSNLNSSPPAYEG